MPLDLLEKLELLGWQVQSTVRSLHLLLLGGKGLPNLLGYSYRCLVLLARCSVSLQLLPLLGVQRLEVTLVPVLLPQHLCRVEEAPEFVFVVGRQVVRETGGCVSLTLTVPERPTGWSFVVVDVALLLVLDEG